MESKKRTVSMVEGKSRKDFSPGEMLVAPLARDVAAYAINGVHIKQIPFHGMVGSKRLEALNRWIDEAMGACFTPHFCPPLICRSEETYHSSFNIDLAEAKCSLVKHNANESKNQDEIFSSVSFCYSILDYFSKFEFTDHFSCMMVLIVTGALNSTSGTLPSRGSPLSKTTEPLTVNNSTTRQGCTYLQGPRVSVFRHTLGAHCT